MIDTTGLVDSTIQLPEPDTGTRPHYCQKMMYSISVLFENWPTDAAGQRPHVRAGILEPDNFVCHTFFARPGPGRMEKAVGRLKK